MKYVIVIPGQLYRGLDALGVYEDASGAAVKAFSEAETRFYGRGTRHFVTGDARTLKEVLAVIAALVDEVDRGVTHCYDLGMERNRLDTCARQPVLPAA